MKTAIPKPSKQSIIREARDYVMIAIGMILYGIGWTVFLLPNDITTGGVPGIASIVYWATGFPVQYTYFTINFFGLLNYWVEVLYQNHLRSVHPDFLFIRYPETGGWDQSPSRPAFHGVCHRSVILWRWNRGCLLS